MRPVLYLDIDDTLLSWASGEPEPVDAAGGFVQWAMECFEVRWLTRWCPNGLMPDNLLGDLSKMIGIETDVLGTIHACNWEDSGIKSDGIAWLEHTVLGRDFVWVEDSEGLSPRDHEVLQAAGFGDRYIPCNVTEDAASLERVREQLEEVWTRPSAA